jgi:hypothetical protein
MHATSTDFLLLFNPHYTPLSIWAISHYRENRLLLSSFHFFYFVCPSFLIYQRISHWTNFHEILYWRPIRISAEKPEIWFKSRKNIEPFTRRPKYRLLLPLTLIVTKVLSSIEMVSNSPEDRGGTNLMPTRHTDKFDVPFYLFKFTIGRLRLKCDGTRAETRFRLSAKRTSVFKSAGASVQSTTGSRGVRISCSNAGYTRFRGSVKGTGYPLHSPVSPLLPRPCVTV